MRLLPFHRLILLFVTGLALCPVATVTFARGRSFPIEVTGTVTSVDRAITHFTMATDQPAGVLALAISRDCKFTRSGVPVTKAILKKGCNIKASYCSTIFTGKIAVEIDGAPAPEMVIGVVESVDAVNKRLSIRVSGNGHSLTFICTSRTRFMLGRHTASANYLRAGLPVRVSYYALEFVPKYAVAVEEEARSKSLDKETVYPR
jgi:hypothetical protein